MRTLHLKLGNLFMFSLSCTGVICVIISRGHYLIDILVAYYVTTRVFWMWHTMAHNQLMMVSFGLSLSIDISYSISSFV